ncbi:hypothetical protein GCM10009717_19680 [Agromyces allii]|uniref:ABC transporter permease n=2 Tax=Agromyces allii TaxID=393607 RepID=A0ABN2QJW8_9MICO
MSEPGMRVREIATEAWRNVWTGASRTALLGGMLAVFAVSLVIADGIAIRASLDDAYAYRQSGASTKTITAVGAIDSRECGAIAVAEGVRGAGAIRKASDPLRPLALPAGSIPVYEVTSSFAALVAAPTEATGIYLAASVAQRLGVGVGDEIPLTVGSAHIAGIYNWPDDGRRSDLGYAALLPVTADGVFDECWAEAWPEPPALPTALRATVMPERVDSSNSPEGGAVNKTFGTQFRGEERYEARVTSFAPYFAVLVSALLTAFAIWLRRLELAAALHVGVRRVDLLATILIEIAMLLVVPITLGSAAAAGFARADPDEFTPLLLIGLRPLVGIIVGTTVGATVATLSIHERNLLRYFARR